MAHTVTGQSQKALSLTQNVVRARVYQAYGTHMRFAFWAPHVASIAILIDIALDCDVHKGATIK